MPANSYYVSTGQPVTLSRGSSALIRAQFAAIENAFYAVELQLSASASAADFKLIYQGARSSDPTQRYNGTQLQNGDLYFNTSSKVMKSFADGAWYALVTSSAAMLKDGGTFTGSIAGTSAVFSSSVTASGFIGSGAGLTGLTSSQITTALAFTPVNAAGDTMTGQLNGTTAVYSSTVRASNFIMSSDERGKMKWKKVEGDVLDRFAKVKKVGLFTDKKTKRVMVGAGAQSMREILPESVFEDEKGKLGIDYGPAALVLIHELTKRVIALEKELEKRK